MSNPLIPDREVAFLLDEVLDVAALCALPAYADHSRETFEMFLRSCRELARDVLEPSYRPMDEHAPQFANGRVKIHPAMREIWPRLVELGIITATCSPEVGGQQLPGAVAVLGNAYLMAGNLSAISYAGLTHGAAHLIETFGDERLKRDYMEKMYAGAWTGTMALTEPQAGSSLADVQTRAKPTGGGHHLISGSKVFITGGDQDLTENIVHLVLARIDGAAPGTKGVSLFCVPRLRLQDGALVDNDVATAGAFHKMGWRAIPSCALSFGERSDCHGWLVGQAGRGLNHMFQMMNEARLGVGAHAAATASVAYQESLEYAKVRPQGRKATAKDASAPQLPIIEHADVRRMLLRQKAIVEGALSLLVSAARYHDLAKHSGNAEEKAQSQLLLDLLTPVAKTFASEYGFESNALAVQIHGGYGYTSEYRPEAWLRDQKLNTIHEGTSGIQSMDLLGRKVIMNGGAALVAFNAAVQATVERARKAGVAAEWLEDVNDAVAAVNELTAHLGALGLKGDVEGLLLHSADYMQLFSIVVIAWQWLDHAAAAREARKPASEAFYAGKLAAAQYWLATELPRVQQLAALCRSGENSYTSLPADSF
ncbi:MAG TPA: acyl-CoA dehydrogenase [Myxococcales bacterium]|nr:acyl-CoA dehydrogenase [Myxococcales bacterium]